MMNHILDATLVVFLYCKKKKDKCGLFDECIEESSHGIQNVGTLGLGKQD